jgi:GNAT superfamily N-acetyltransferase
LAGRCGKAGGVEVRRATTDDAGSIAFVHVRSWQAAYRGHVPDEFLDALSVGNRTDAWVPILGGLDPPRVSVLVLLDDAGSVLGFASLGPSRDDDAVPESGEVMAIYLLPATWGTGGGRQLMNEAVDELRRGGFTDASLWVLDTNARARRFYERAGWAADGTAKDDSWGAFVLHEVHYRRRLGDAP